MERGGGDGRNQRGMKDDYSMRHSTKNAVLLKRPKQAAQRDRAPSYLNGLITTERIRRRPGSRARDGQQSPPIWGPIINFNWCFVLLRCC